MRAVNFMFFKSNQSDTHMKMPYRFKDYPL
jgi:hypothetical protein